jgi:hypothetical protein
VIQHRYVVSLSFRPQDKLLLDNVLLLAKTENKDLTSFTRDALAEFVASKQSTVPKGEKKIDEFLDIAAIPRVLSFDRVLTPKELERWPNEDLIRFARIVKARREETASELKRRGFNFIW